MNDDRLFVGGQLLTTDPVPSLCPTTASTLLIVKKRNSK